MFCQRSKSASVWLLAAALQAGTATAAPPAELAPELERRTAQLLAQSDSPADTAAELLQQEQQGQLTHADASATLRLLSWYQQQNPYERADYLLRTLGRDWSPARHNAFCLERAQVMLQFDQPREAERLLRRLREPLDPASAEQRQSLLGLALMRQQHFGIALRELETRQGFPRTSLYDHYNFAVVLVEQGRRIEGLALLDELGQGLAGNDPEQQALIDRANLAVGWYWLGEQQGGTARAFFKRVSLDGPHSSRALLGLGWAELAADGKPQSAHFKRQLYCDDLHEPTVSVTLLLFNPYLFCRPGRRASNFKYHHHFAFVAGARGPDRFRRALRYWRVLEQRHASDPASQEAWLAIGYAYDRLRDGRQAETAYRSAIQRYELEITRLRTLEQALRLPDADAPALLARHSQPGEFADLRVSPRYLQAQSGLASLRESERRLQDLRQRTARMAGSAGNGRDGLQQLQARQLHLQSGLADTRVAVMSDAAALCLREVVQQRQRLDQYLSNAVLALARLLDRRGAGS